MPRSATGTTSISSRPERRQLAAFRDNFAATMTAEAAEEYEAEFNRAVLVRLPRFALEIEEL